MAENTKIEWASHTFNPWRGCTKVSDGCTNCYAETMSGRNPKTLGVWGKQGTRVVASESMWRQPLKWDKAAEAAGERHRVFCASLADVFEARDTMPEDSWQAVDAARLRLFQLIDETKNLDWLLLTKRPENVPDVLWKISQGTYGGGWNLTHMPNVWLGTSVEDQKTADERIPKLLSIPAAVHWLSMEPLLGPVDLIDMPGPMPEPLDPGEPSTGFEFELMETREWDWLGHEYSLDEETFAKAKEQGWLRKSFCKLCGMSKECPWHRDQSEPYIDWVIVGGESGPNARPMHPDWVRSIRDQCQAAGVPFFFKQFGEWAPSSITRNFTREFKIFDDGSLMYKVGKKAAGRLLDGREHNEFPKENIDAARA